jgi:predicted Rossmann fold flavoprotein
MMAAIRAAQLKRDVALIEKESSPGKKLLLSGKGRCNLTNACDLNSFLKRFSPNGQFLRDAFKKFFNSDLINFFEKRGLKLKVERQQRVFPVSNRAGSILEVLIKELRRLNVEIRCGARLKDIFVQGNRVKGVLFNNSETIAADRIILATGGLSYSFTGSTGEGIDLARRLGHRIVPLRPGLVPLEARQQYVGSLQGLTLKNIRIKFSNGKNDIVSEIGELLFTSFGISGPLVLSVSGQVADWLSHNEHVNAEIDLKPALSVQQLNARLLREFKLNPKKSIRNILKNLLPARAVDIFIGSAGIPGDKKANQVSQEERRHLLSLLKALRLSIVRTRPIEEAMITRGGVSLKDINPRTMESRIIKGLYFAGEMIDVDADTGGFNLQAAFSTGYLAGDSAAGSQP